MMRPRITPTMIGKTLEMSLSQENTRFHDLPELMASSDAGRGLYCMRNCEKVKVDLIRSSSEVIKIEKNDFFQKW